MTYGGLLAWYMLDHFGLVNLLRDVNNDDSFYYFQIAKNMAAGEFSSFDEGITRTNGYHPLWVLLITPFYWVFDSENALFAIKAFEITLVAGSVLLIVIAARICRLPWVVLVVVLPYLYRYHGLFRGLEAAAAIFMLGLLFLALIQYARDQVRNSWFLVTVLFLLPWVRLEFLAISLTIGVLVYIISVFQELGDDKTSGRELILSARSVQAALPFFSALSGLFLYFVYNHLVFGGYIPVSAAVKQTWTQVLWEGEGGYNIVDNFLDIVLHMPMFNLELLVALEMGFYLLLVWYFTKKSSDHNDRMFLFFLLGVFSLAAGHLAKFAQTVLMIDPKYGSYSWYFVPGYLMMALSIPVRCYVARYMIQRFIKPKSPRLSRILIRGIVFTGVAFLLIQGNLLRPFDYVNRASEETSQDWETVGYLGTQVMNLILPEDSVVGSWDAGVIGYFSNTPVVNLDGLVNSYDYFQAKFEGNEERFYRKFGISHFANVRPVKFTNDNLIFEGTSFFNETAQYEYEFKLWSAQPSVTVNQMTQHWPRLETALELVSYNMYILFNNRFAQVIAKECATELIKDQMFVFSWHSKDNGSAESTSYTWSNPRTNRLGFCVEAFQLPEDITHPISVDLVKAREAIH